MHGRAPPLLNDEPASGLSARVRPAGRQVVNLVENRVMRVAPPPPPPYCCPYPCPTVHSLC